MSKIRPENAKFALGDFIHYKDISWTVDDYGQCDGEDNYVISTPNGSGSYVIFVSIKDGNEYFRKA